MQAVPEKSYSSWQELLQRSSRCLLGIKFSKTSFYARWCSCTFVYVPVLLTFICERHSHCLSSHKRSIYEWQWKKEHDMWSGTCTWDFGDVMENLCGASSWYAGFFRSTGILRLWSNGTSVFENRLLPFKCFFFFILCVLMYLYQFYVSCGAENSILPTLLLALVFTLSL